MLGNTGQWGRFVSSTIVNNYSSFPGGGIEGNSGFFEITKTILANNRTRFQFSPDIVASGRALDVNYSIIGNTAGTEIGPNTGVGNLLNVDPRLGPLADHGGPTYTHALLPGSPAIDAGDPDLPTDEMRFDQRGFARVANGGLGLRLDIGAYESQGIPDYPVGDFNHDGIANLADYTVWRDTLGDTTDLVADASGNNVVDADDYAIWKQHFGNTTIPLTSVPPTEAALDAALAMFVSPEDEPRQTTGLSGQISRGAEDHRSGGTDDELLRARGARGEPAKRLGEAESPDSRPEVSTDGSKIHLNLRIYWAGLAGDVT